VFDVPADYPAKDRKFVEELAASLRLDCQRLENEQGELYLALSHYGNSDSDDEEEEGEGEGEEDSGEDEEGFAAVLRVLKQYDKAQVVDVSADEAKAELERKYRQGFYQWKDEYYKVCFFIPIYMGCSIADSIL